MRIGFDASILAGPTRLTGMGRYAESLLRALAEDSGGDEVVAFWPSTEAPPFGARGGLQWRVLKSIRAGKLSTFATYAMSLPREVERSRIDVFHAPAVHTRPSMPPVPASLPCPLVVTLHDVIPLTHYLSEANPMPLRMRLFYRWNLRRALRAQGIVTVSQFSRSEIAAQTGTEPGRINVVHNGVELQESADAASVLEKFGLSTPFILYVGSMEPRKNLSRLLEAFDDAGNWGLESDLVLVTDPASGHAPALRTQLATMAYADRVRILHNVSGPELAALYVAARTFAFPSLSEGFGFPPLEAMLCGTPVLASDRGSLPEVLDDAAFYADAFDTRSIRDGLLALDRDDHLRQRLIERGTQVAAGYSWRRAAHETADVYRSVAGVALAMAL